MTKRLVIQLYDALDNLICQLYADGPNRQGEERAFRAMGNFEKEFGKRHNGKWEGNKQEVDADNKNK